VISDQGQEAGDEMEKPKVVQVDFQVLADSHLADGGKKAEILKAESGD
jgi:hypothetical protein